MARPRKDIKWRMTDGTVITPDDIIRKTAEQGKPLGRRAAVERIRNVIRGTMNEEKLCQMPLKRKSRKNKWDELPPDRKKTLNRLIQFNRGELNLNEFLGGD